MIFQKSVSYFLLLLCTVVSSCRGEFCSYDEECQHGGYCDDSGFAAGGDPNHPHIYESRCVCSKSYTGPYCTEVVSGADNEGTVTAKDDSFGNKKRVDDDDAAKNGSSMPTGAIVGLSLLVPAILVLGLGLGIICERRRSKFRSKVFSPPEETMTGDGAGRVPEIVEEKERDASSDSSSTTREDSMEVV
jgi:hypothetical protein